MESCCRDLIYTDADARLDLVDDTVCYPFLWKYLIGDGHLEWRWEWLILHKDMKIGRFWSEFSAFIDDCCGI